ncbi:hypothetical protein INT44_002373 [Umbelopsis vinacea]|uniref:Uncharacterized protein n=1 Tax=Umbelopsis vinacea TaxID=44442 RepID=A0A8H7Q5B3_9FUNG|nr:hypothetical protein INT44_002373 [Umbelopsis vinacea]
MLPRRIVMIEWIEIRQFSNNMPTQMYRHGYLTNGHVRKPLGSNRLISNVPSVKKLDHQWTKHAKVQIIENVELDHGNYTYVNSGEEETEQASCHLCFMRFRIYTDRSLFVVACKHPRRFGYIR